jgi:hypothetical protein
VAYDSEPSDLPVGSVKKWKVVTEQSLCTEFVYTGKCETCLLNN